MNRETVKISLPPKLVDVFRVKRGDVQYRGAYGGRGSGKSFSFAEMAAVWGYVEPLRILCTREFQASIKESFHAELKAAIESEDWLSEHYDVGVDYLRGNNGTEFIFRGLRHGVSTIKSLAKIDLTIVEEAEDVPEAAWLALEATVFRQPKSELWAIWNPRTDGSPVDNRLRKNKPDNAIVAEMNWHDNPFFPEGLETLRKREQERLDPNTYAHIWEGAYLTNSDAQVFAGKYRIADFDISPSWDGPYQGGDFGFSQDPTAAVRCYISGDVLYVSHEAYKTQLELDDTAVFVSSKIPDFDRYVTRWDNARPESISYLKRHGLPRSEAVSKWKGSVEDGVQFLRSFREIIIHSRCTNLAREFRLYSYKVDRNTGDVLPVIVDAFNHCCIAEGEIITCERGNVPIERVTTNDRVLTRQGYRKVLFSGETGKNRETLEIATTVGRLRCTPDHKIWTQRGFVEAGSLRHGDIVTSLGVCSWSKELSGMAHHIGDIQRVNGCQIDDILSAHTLEEVNISTEMFGDTTMGKYQKNTKYTIKTGTQATTTSQTWLAYLRKFMQPSILLTRIGSKDKNTTLTRLDPLQKVGMQAMKGEKNIAKLVDFPTSILTLIQNTVNIVLRNLNRENLAASTSFAATHVRVHGDEQQGLMTSKEPVSNAAGNLPLTNTQKPKLVQGCVLGITAAGQCERVYDLTVNDDHEFFVNGVLVHNCDALRYSVNPMIKGPRQKSKPLFGTYGRVSNG